MCSSSPADDSRIFLTCWINQPAVRSGADRTILGPADARRLRIDANSLPLGAPSTGVGGQSPTRTIAAIVSLNGCTMDLTRPVLFVLPGRPGFGIPSLLGRDVLSQFALFLDQQRDLVLLLTPAEAAALSPP